MAIIEQVAAALDAVHRLGMLHRHVKPSNILIADDDFAYISDLYTAERALTDEGLMRWLAVQGRPAAAGELTDAEMLRELKLLQAVVAVPLRLYVMLGVVA